MNTDKHFPAGSLAKCREMRIIRALVETGKPTAWWDILTSILGKGRCTRADEKKIYSVAMYDLVTNNIVSFTKGGYCFTTKGKEFVEQLKDNGVDISEF